MKQTTADKRINLVDGYWFSTDGVQYILNKSGTRNKIDLKTRKQTDEIIEYTDTIGYYTDITSMLKACVKDANMSGIISGDIKSLNDCLNQMTDLYDKLSDLTNGY